MNGLIKIVKSLEEFGLLTKGVKQPIKNEAKEQKGGCLGTVLRASLLGSLLASKVAIRAGEGTSRAGQVLNAASSINKFWNAKVLLKRI